MNDRHPLIEVSEHVEAEARRARVAVIFDLDSTLFCVSPRTQAILRRLGHDEEFQRLFTDASKVLREIEVLPTDYGFQNVMARYSIEPTPELRQHVRKYWGRYFFSNHFLDHDTLYPSAMEYVTHLHGLGAEILYLTGRARSAMREGTLQALKRCGLPLFEDSRLYMKPNEVEADETFKAIVLQDLVKTYDHIWFFENEPVIIHQVRRLAPQVRMIFVKSVHSGRAAEPDDLRTIGPDFTPGLPMRDAATPVDAAKDLKKK